MHERGAGRVTWPLAPRGGSPLMEVPSGFEGIRYGRTSLVLRSALRHWLEPILRATPSGWPGYSVRHLSGGRGGVTVVGAADTEVVLRPYRRGGVPAWIIRDTYFGWRARPFHELAVTEMLRRRRVSVIEVHGAVVHWRLPGVYRGWLATRYIADAQTLWQWVHGPPAAADRAEVFAQVGRAVRGLHAGGACHPDLNLNNILLRNTAPIDIVLIDFDRARLGTSARSAAADLTRLERSARKLDPRGEWVTTADLKALRVGYADNEFASALRDDALVDEPAL